MVKVVYPRRHISIKLHRRTLVTVPAKIHQRSRGQMQTSALLGCKTVTTVIEHNRLSSVVVACKFVASSKHTRMQHSDALDALPPRHAQSRPRQGGRPSYLWIGHPRHIQPPALEFLRGGNRDGDEIVVGEDRPKESNTVFSVRLRVQQMSYPAPTHLWTTNETLSHTHTPL